MYRPEPQDAFRADELMAYKAQREFNESLIDGVRKLNYVLDDDLPDATDQLAMDLADEFDMDVDDVFVRVCNAHEISLPCDWDDEPDYGCKDDNHFFGRE